MLCMCSNNRFIVLWVTYDGYWKKILLLNWSKKLILIQDLCTKIVIIVKQMKNTNYIYQVGIQYTWSEPMDKFDRLDSLSSSRHVLWSVNSIFVSISWVMTKFFMGLLFVVTDFDWKQRFFYFDKRILYQKTSPTYLLDLLFGQIIPRLFFCHRVLF